MKTIQIKSVSPIALSAATLVMAVNELRKEHGKGKKGKAPVNIEGILSNLRVLENADSKHSMLSFELIYDDDNGTPCSRDFPNYGLDIKSDSNIEQNEDILSVNIDLTLKVGNPKWHLAEMQECAAIFATKKFSFRLSYSLDQTTDSAGYSIRIMTNLDDHEMKGILGSTFEVQCK